MTTGSDSHGVQSISNRRASSGVSARKLFVNQQCAGSVSYSHATISRPLLRQIRRRRRGMRIPAAVFGLVLEATFLVYCIYMIYLLDVLDPFPREWMIPNILIGGAILIFGYLFASGRHRAVGHSGDEKWSESGRRISNLPH